MLRIARSDRISFMTDALKSEKTALRENARLHRDRMIVDDTDFEAVIDVFFAEVNPPQDKIISLYWPYGKEFDCRFLMDELVTRGFKCALPVAGKQSRVMKFLRWTHDTKMQDGAWGVPEPIEGAEVTPDLVLAPLLAFDQKGYRLGQGGGHYDTTLEALRNKQATDFIGIGFAEQAVLLKLPREAHDIPLDAMLTPQGLIRF